MGSKFLQWVGIGVLSMVVLAACGGDDDDGSVESDDADETTSTVDDVATDEEDDDEPEDEPVDDDEPAEEAELPQFLDDFERVCSTGVGFAGATAYDAASPGPHPVVLFEPYGNDGNLITTSRTLPAGWTVDEDLDFEDNGELAGAELVACGERVVETENGTTCELDDDGEPVTLVLVDTTIEFRVFEAVSGTEVGVVSMESASTECPFFVSYDPDDPRYFNTPDDDEIINFLKPFVTP